MKKLISMIFISVFVLQAHSAKIDESSFIPENAVGMACGTAFVNWIGKDDLMFAQLGFKVDGMQHKSRLSKAKVVEFTINYGFTRDPSFFVSTSDNKTIFKAKQPEGQPSKYGHVWKEGNSIKFSSSQPKSGIVIAGYGIPFLAEIEFHSPEHATLTINFVKEVKTLVDRGWENGKQLVFDCATLGVK